MKIAVLGAGGFVGSHLVPHIIASGHRVVRIVTRSRVNEPDLGMAGTRTRWMEPSPNDAQRRAALRGCDAVICLIARNPPALDRQADPAAAYLRANRDIPVGWALSAARAGLSRFVFVSSIKAVADRAAEPLAESAPPHPTDAYGISKLAAETALHEAPELATVPPVIVRPPLVYGPRVRGNALGMLRLAASSWPLPLGAADAPRSMIAVTNLASALLACAVDPTAAGRTFHVCDDHSLSVADIIGQLRHAAGRPAGLLTVNTRVLEALGALFRRQATIARLTQPLLVDGRLIQQALDWRPPVTVEQALGAWMQDYLVNRGKSGSRPRAAGTAAAIPPAGTRP